MMKYLKNWIFVPALMLCLPILAQNSLLVNFGSTTCVTPSQPSFSLIKNPLGFNPTVLNTCGLNNQIPNFYAVFISYNPKDNKIYVADVRTFTQSSIWQLDIGLPEAIACPSTIPMNPTFTTNYVSNNFEFDNNGDIWSFSAYDFENRRCNLDKFDLETGQVINTRVLEFPQGNAPNAITSGDLCILPNGRMFATLGDNPSRLYEIENYTAPNQTATARFLRAMPQNCYGIAYLNGVLQVTGTNLFNSCYYFIYDFVNDTISEQKTFQNGQTPIDNTSITPSIGATKRLANATKVNANTADLTYELYVRNMGNTILNDMNVTEDLAKAFGAANISNLSVSFAPGGNPANLLLNPLYNGTTEPLLFQQGQSLPNQSGNNQDYFVQVQISLRATNLQANKVYLNSAIATATINNEVDRVIITDSSNNGMPSDIDPNNNGNPTEIGENIPTPFDFSLLPVKFLGFTGRLVKPAETELRWRIAVPAEGADYFEVQWGTTGIDWHFAGIEKILYPNQSDYIFRHSHAAQNELFYRLKQFDKDGQFIYSPVIRLTQTGNQELRVFPNPATDRIQIQIPEWHSNTTISLVDMTGRVVLSRTAANAFESLFVGHIASGLYQVVIANGSQKNIQRVMIKK
jgi:hypothetical protein